METKNCNHKGLMTIDEVVSSLKQHRVTFHEKEFHNEIFEFGIYATRKNRYHDKYIGVYVRRVANYLHGIAMNRLDHDGRLVYDSFDHYYDEVGYSLEYVKGEWM